MFFEIFILQKKGPLGVVWLASHYEKRLSKSNILETDLDGIPIQLLSQLMQSRLQGHLLLGCCRIYRRKVELLYLDASEAVIKVRSAFRPGIIDLEKSTVNGMIASLVVNTNVQASTITMPEIYGGLEIEIPQLDSNELPEIEEGLITFNTARIRDITFVNDIDTMRNTQVASGSLDLMSPEDKFLADRDMLNPDITSQFELRDIDLLAGDNFNLADTQLQGYEDQLLNGSWDKLAIELSGEKEPVLSLPELSSYTRPHIKKVKSISDAKTQLTTNQMRCTIENPAPLLRSLNRALPSKSLIQKKLKFDTNPEIFQYPSLDYPPQLLSNFKRGTDITFVPSSNAEISLPSIEEARNKSSDQIGFDGLDMNQFDADFGDYREQEQEMQPALIVDDEEQAPIRRDEEDHQRSGEVQKTMTKRTKAMHVFLDKRFHVEGETLLFQDVMKGKPRRSVAIAFLELLCLKGRNIIDISQRKMYSTITITKLDSFTQILQ